MKPRKQPQKTIGSVVTPQEYAEILMKSANEGLTMSAYTHKKLFSNDVKTLEKGGGLDAVTIKEVDKKETLDKIKKLESEVLSLKTENNALKSTKTPLKSILKDVDEETIKYLDELFKINKISSNLLQNRANPYYDVVNKIEQKLDLLKKKQ